MKIFENREFIGQIRSTKDRQRGFTLIELVVVLAVLGVLAAIGIPQLTGLQEQARISGAATNISSEVGNTFARDLAAGLDSNNVGDISDINWSSGGALCGRINDQANDSDGESGADVVPTLAGDFELVSENPDDNAAAIQVPTYDGTITNDTQECFVNAT